MKKFMGSDFLLTNEKGAELYNCIAKGQPIYDYHCHLSAKDIAEDRHFSNIGELMLEGDHYKWRIMRAAGVPETKISDRNTPYKDKFLAFAEILPYFIGNPIYHWTHLELQKYFKIREPLSDKTAERIWSEANEQISEERISARSLITSSNVELIATTDDPIDNLAWHGIIKQNEDFNTRVVPAFRPDQVLKIDAPDFKNYLLALGKSKNTVISSLDDLLEVLGKRIDFFAANGCRLADHGMERAPLLRGTYTEAKTVLAKVLAGGELTLEEAEKYRFYMLSFFAGEYTKRNWAMQLHFSPLRNCNTKLFNQLGPDCGVDSVGDPISAQNLKVLFDEIELAAGMPKTILYSMNPSAYYILASMAGNFQGGSVGKMQLGAPWWMLDHRDGILEQLRLLANTGGLGLFVGMLTDSRSFLAYVRHDYFRRVLCSLIGEWVEAGEVPDDSELLGNLVKGVCVENARLYFAM